MNGRVQVCDQTGTAIVYDAALRDLDVIEKELIELGTFYLIANAEEKTTGSQPARGAKIPSKESVISAATTSRFC
jgi:hypothetical protein